MSKIMTEFGFEFDRYENENSDLNWQTIFDGQKYPPKITLKSTEAPLYKMAGDGEYRESAQAVITIVGTPELRVETSGDLKTTKKDLTKLINKGAALLNLFLHGFMEERKEIEAAQNRATG